MDFILVANCFSRQLFGWGLRIKDCLHPAMLFSTFVKPSIEQTKNSRNFGENAKKLRCTYIPWRWLSFCYHVEGNKRVASRRLRYANKHIMRRCDIDTEDYEC